MIMVTNCYPFLHLQGTETDSLISWQGGVRHTNNSESDSSALQIYSKKTVHTFLNS